MTEPHYRLFKAVLLTIFVVGMLYIGFLFSQNGRYTQYDMRCDYSPDGKEHHLSPDRFFDTRTGRKILD